MIFTENKSLLSFNSFRLPALARWYCEVSDTEQLREAASFANQRNLDPFVIGGGTNIVLTGDIDGLVIHNRIEGMDIGADALVVGAGADWHEFVARTVSAGIGGLENLALIPGSAGAAPVQNIGAYGVELSDRFAWLDACHMKTLESVRFEGKDCRFTYRDSYFKKDGNWCITRLGLRPSEAIVMTYPGVNSYLEQRNLAPSHEGVFKAVCHLRRAKLPDVHQQPNVGSFFKNPIVDADAALGLRQRFRDIPQHKADGMIKLSAAWLIEQAGLKGASEGGVSVSDTHALVLVNRGQGSVSQLRALVQQITAAVQKKFGVTLDIEPIVYPDNL